MRCKTSLSNLVIFLLLALQVSENNTFSLQHENIMGGQLAVRGQFPHLVSVQYNNTHQCGGSIVNKRWVLMAAHCVAQLDSHPENFYAAVDLLKLSESNQTKRYQGERIESYYWFNPFDLYNDICLLRVNEDIEFNEYVQPVQLQQGYFDDVENAVLAGWGSVAWPGDNSDDLLWIDTQTTTYDYCNSTLSKRHPIMPQEICTLDKEGVGACHGDSGSPLILTNGTQIGIVSWGVSCATGVPDVYTRVSSFYDWIQSFVNDISDS